MREKVLKMPATNPLPTAAAEVAWKIA